MEKSILGVNEWLLMQNFYQTMTTNCNIVSTQCILCNVKFGVYYLYVCLVSCARVWRRNEFEILRTQIKKNGKSVDNSKASHPVHAAPTSKQLLLPERTANSTNPSNEKDEAETNHQTITITLTRDMRKCLINSSSGNY